MWTSRRPGPTGPRRLALDAIGLAVALAFLPELAAVRAGAVLDPHPGWIAVLVLSARYGGGGLFMGLLAAATAVGTGSAAAGTALGSSWSRLDSGPNLVAFAACLAAAWVGSWHLRCQEELNERSLELSERAGHAEVTIEVLRDVVRTLRARVDRSTTSLSFLRDVAVRLEGTDPVAAAEAAADLALARTGAAAAAIQVGVNGRQRLLGVRDLRTHAAPAPLAVDGADLTVPIHREGDRFGCIALWGVPRHALDEATAHDLALIASWCAPSVAIAEWRSRAAAAPEGSAL